MHPFHLSRLSSFLVQIKICFSCGKGCFIEFVDDVSLTLFSLSLSLSSRLLMRKARKVAAQYELQYHEPIPVSQLVQKVAAVMQEYTQSG